MSEESNVVPADPGSDPAAGTSEPPETTGDSSPSPDPATIESRRRELQSQLDRERAKSGRLEAQIRELQSTGTAAAAAGEGLTEDSVSRIVAGALQRERAKVEFASRASETYPNASPDVLADLSQYRTVDEMELALARSHDAGSAQLRVLQEQVEAGLRARFGEHATAPPDGGPPPGAGDQLTAASVRGMSLKELLDPKVGEQLERLSRSVE